MKQCPPSNFIFASPYAQISLFSSLLKQLASRGANNVGYSHFVPGHTSLGSLVHLNNKES